MLALARRFRSALAWYNLHDATINRSIFRFLVAFVVAAAAFVVVVVAVHTLK